MTAYLRIKRTGGAIPGSGTGPCGTYAGWNAHMVAKEQPCAACKAASAAYLAMWRFRTGRQRGPWRCQCGSVFPEHTCHLTHPRKEQTP